MKGNIELIAGSALDKNDIEEIQNAIEAAMQGTGYGDDLFSVTTTRVMDTDTGVYYFKVSAPSGWTTDNYAGMERRLRSSLLCHVEFAKSPCSSTAHLSDAPLTEPSIPAFEPTESKPPPTRASQRPTDPHSSLNKATHARRPSHIRDAPPSRSAAHADSSPFSFGLLLNGLVRLMPLVPVGSTFCR